MEESKRGATPEFTASDAASIIHYMQRGRLTQSQRELLTTDYAAKSSALDSTTKAKLNEQVIKLHLPDTLILAGESTNSAANGDRIAKDVAIITVVAIELLAARSVFGFDWDRFEAGANGTRYFPCSVTSARLARDLTVIVTNCEGAYELNAAQAANELLARYHVGIIFLVGIAAGNSDKLSYGDVVIPRVVYNFEAVRREADGDRSRPRSHNVPMDVGRNLNYYSTVRTDFAQLARTHLSGLEARHRPPGFNLRRFKPKLELDNATLSSSSALIADGTTMDELRERDQLLIAADQESYGFAHAARGSSWAVFRGISDHGEVNKPNNWQYVAASTASLATKDFLEREYLPSSGVRK